MFRRFVVPVTVMMILIMGLVACATENAEETATYAPTASPLAKPLPTIALPTEQSATPVPPIQAFGDQLMQALERRDFAQLQGLMGDAFMIAGWRSEGTAHTPEQAVEQLQNTYLGQDTTLVFDPYKDLVALLDGTDPLSILGPDVAEPRAMFVSGWGLEGQDQAILYIAHRADGTQYWYGILLGLGGFAPATSGEVPETESILAIPEAGAAVGLPPGQMLMKNTELYRRGSFASYDFVLREGVGYPYPAEIQFFSRESIEGFAKRCAGAEYPCFFGDFPDLERYDGQKAAFAQFQDYDGFSLQEFGGRHYFVSQHPCEGAPCVVREYTTFVGDTKVDVWVMMADASADDSQTARADALFSQLRIQGDWAGIGAIPGPPYNLLDPGVTLRHPLGWAVREETGSNQDFVVHSVSFIPPAFAHSDQPQVPAINLFVYGCPLADTLQAWLDAYSTEAPFGSEASPDTRFFGVRDTEEIRTASFRGLRFTHDVLGLTAHELLFAVGPTVMGLSYVDFGPEDLGSAFLQMQSSLAAANTTIPVQDTDVKTILALADLAMYRGPGVTYQQIGEVMDGQLALVTGVSDDGQWWRVICPNDTIGDCWVSANSALTRPIAPPGVDPELTWNSSWTEYRDERYGYGLAIPCHWVSFPPPLEGNVATLTLRSYDDEFFMKNSVKGEWKNGQWPDGAVKMDVTAIEGVPPDQALSQFVRELLLRNEFSMLETLEEIAVGSHQAVSAVTASSNDPSDRHTTIAFRLAPDKALLLSALPEEAWESGDVQGVLNSISLLPEENITTPAYSPGPPIIKVPEECRN